MKQFEKTILSRLIKHEINSISGRNSLVSRVRKDHTHAHNYLNEITQATTNWKCQKQNNGLDGIKRKINVAHLLLEYDVEYMLAGIARDFMQYSNKFAFSFIGT